MPGWMPGSYSLFDFSNFNTPGLQKAMNTDAAAFKPNVFEKKSTLKPIANDDSSNSQPAVSKGNNKIK